MVSEHLCIFQHGFRLGHSCETAVAKLTQFLFSSIDKRNGKALVVFVDFSKAFDSLNHVLLLRKLMSNYDNSVEPHMVKLLQNYFQNRYFLIRNGNYTSKSYDIMSGTPAGSCLGPLTFSLFINDISDGLSLPFLSYAGDLHRMY